MHIYIHTYLHAYIYMHYFWLGAGPLKIHETSISTVKWF